MEPEQQQQEADDALQQQLSSAILDNYTVTPGPGAEIQSYTTFQQPMVPIPEAAEAAGGGSAAGQSDSAAAGGSDRGRTGSVQSGACKTAVPLSELLVPNDDDPDLYDPNCDPDKPQIVRFQDVSAAAFKIRSGIVRTPCDEQKQRGVVAASAGNHALALAYHGQELGIPIVVVMPTIAPLMKINACVQCGARVIVMGSHIGESKNVALKIAKSEGLLYVNGYDHPQILAGQGTIGLEILEQIGKPVDAIVLPVGGGGLIAGVAVGVKTMSPDTLIIGAEPERSASFSAAMQAGHPVRVALKSSLADGLAVPLAGANAFYSCRDLVDRMVTVSEEFIALSILRLIELEKTVVEGAGAAALAALLQGCLPELHGKTVAVVLGGGNIDTTVLGRVIERGLAVDGRLIHFVATVSDRPGGIAECSSLLAGMGVSIKDIFHERAWLKYDIFQVNLRCVCEVRDREHGEELLAKLKEHYGPGSVRQI
ncbi:hypothetical protein BOX15_Mlig016886g1 [Macrostomum lignano]|uniref:L-serine deaminase n=1 Tax=Macrostomum lignano TaxID=282301 RepID=A0A267EWQ7_9PLAT|nr:hypothetical protein BOX15_Mlig016886g1 [Macrostomum lignano]